MEPRPKELFYSFHLYSHTQYGFYPQTRAPDFLWISVQMKVIKQFYPSCVYQGGNREARRGANWTTLSRWIAKCCSSLTWLSDTKTQGLSSLQGVKEKRKYSVYGHRKDPVKHHQAFPLEVLREAGVRAGNTFFFSSGSLGSIFEESFYWTITSGRK